MTVAPTPPGRAAGNASVAVGGDLDARHFRRVLAPLSAAIWLGGRTARALRRSAHTAPPRRTGRPLGDQCPADSHLAKPLVFRGPGFQTRDPVRRTRGLRRCVRLCVREPRGFWRRQAPSRSDAIASWHTRQDALLFPPRGA
jgi:hypothetical protein